MFLDADEGVDIGPLRAETLVETIILELYRLSRHPATRLRPPRSRLSPLDLKRIDAYLDAECARKITQADLAALVSVPTTTFSQSFKEVTGFSAYQYLLKRRIEKAEELLAHGKLSLAQIASDCGFSSQAHMTDVFRKRIGCTPGAYRNEMR